MCHSRLGTERDSSERRGEGSGDKNRQRDLFSPTNLNGSGSSQPAGTHEILFDCCNPSHLLTHRDVCECICIWVCSWDLASCDNSGREKREREKSFRVMLLFNGIFFHFLVHQHLKIYMNCHVGLINSHSAILI